MFYVNAPHGQNRTAFTDSFSASSKTTMLPPAFARYRRAFGGCPVGTAHKDHVEAIRHRKRLPLERKHAGRGVSSSRWEACKFRCWVRVHAGNPHAAHENVEGHLPVGAGNVDDESFCAEGPRRLDDRRRHSRRRHVGRRPHSSRCERRRAAIVVARLDDEATVKRLRRKSHKTFFGTRQPALSQHRVGIRVGRRGGGSSTEL